MDTRLSKIQKVLTHLGAINKIKSNKVFIDIVEPDYQNYNLTKNKWDLKGGILFFN